MSQPVRRGPWGFQVIGALKLASGLISLAVVVGLFHLFQKDLGQALEDAVLQFRVDPRNHFIHMVVSRLSGIDRKTLHAIEAGTFFYALLHIVEGTGLVFRRRWAAYLTVVATSSLLPVEGYEILRKHTPIRIALLILNLGIVIYLLVRLRTELRHWEEPRSEARAT